MQVHIADSSVGRSIPVRFEWRAPHKELVHEHPQTPHVGRLVVLTPLHHLGREVVQRAAERGPPRRGGVHRPAEVGDLDIVLQDKSQVKIHNSY